MGIRRRIADALELQHDVALNLPVFHVTGSERMLLENHNGLLEYGKTKIRVATPTGNVEISGENLTIKAMNRDEILILGSISSVMVGKPVARP